MKQHFNFPSILSQIVILLVSFTAIAESNYEQAYSQAKGFRTIDGVVAYAQKNNVQFVDLDFIDMYGAIKK